MECISKHVTILKLNQKESEWLRDIMQNPIGVLFENECDTDRNMREEFFNALTPSTSVHTSLKKT